MSQEESMKSDLKNIPQVIMYYREMERFSPSLSREVCRQYKDMAAGGDGGMAHHVGEPIQWDEDGEPIAWKSIRENNYPGYPDEWFEEVCHLLEW